MIRFKNLRLLQYLPYIYIYISTTDPFDTIYCGLYT